MEKFVKNKIGDKGQETISNIIGGPKNILPTQRSAAVTMWNVANIASVHSSNLYYYFPGKLASIQKLISHVLNSYTEHLDETSR